MTELEKLVEFTKERSRAIFNEDGEIVPTFFCHVPNVNGYGMIPCHWENSEQKHLIVCLVKTKFLELGVDRYAFVAESWIANRSGNESADLLPPSQSPNRQECIFIHAEEKGGLSKTGQFPIKRDGEKVLTGEFVNFEGGLTGIGMIFSNMFGENASH
jgi:hypothetical protein